MIIILPGAAERLVGVPKTYLYFSVFAQDRQWMQLETYGSARGETLKHTHNHDGSNPLLVQMVVFGD